MRKFFLIPALFILILLGCKEEIKINPGHVLQVKDVGLRKGVFLRRYQLTTDHGKHKTFTADTLKAFIERMMETDYLFIQDAYTLGMDRDAGIKQKIIDNEIKVLSQNHPVFTETLNLSDDELNAYYQQKTTVYDVELIQSNAYYDVDSLYQLKMKKGPGASLKSLFTSKFKKEEMGLSFPRYLTYESITYGDQIPVALLDQVSKMKVGDLSKPIDTGPVWTIVRLLKKAKNSKLKPFDELKSELIYQLQAIKKSRQVQDYVEALRTSYTVTIDSAGIQSIIRAYQTTGDGRGTVDQKKIEKERLSSVFLTINEDHFSLHEFLIIFGNANRFNMLSKLTQEDLMKFIDNFLEQYLLAADVREKGIVLDELTVDQLENKTHRLLLSKYLKEQIADKISMDESDLQKYYESHKDHWKGDYKTVRSSVAGELRNELLMKRRDELWGKLKRKYGVHYNMPLLTQLADSLTAQKNEKKKEKL